ncbi:hypothetical protein BC938DRAFT_471906, partial [Jimgerdemannia flammicorona]
MHPPHFLIISPEILVRISTNLLAYDRIRLALTCRTLYMLLTQATPQAWNRLNFTLPRILDDALNLLVPHWFPPVRAFIPECRITDTVLTRLLVRTLHPSILPSIHTLVLDHTPVTPTSFLVALQHLPGLEDLSIRHCHSIHLSILATVWLELQEMTSLSHSNLRRFRCYGAGITPMVCDREIPHDAHTCRSPKLDVTVIDRIIAAVPAACVVDLHRCEACDEWPAMEKPPRCGECGRKDEWLCVHCVVQCATCGIRMCDECDPDPLGPGGGFAVLECKNLWCGYGEEGRPHLRALQQHLVQQLSMGRLQATFERTKLSALPGIRLRAMRSRVVRTVLVVGMPDEKLDGEDEEAGETERIEEGKDGDEMKCDCDDVKDKKRDREREADDDTQDDGYDCGGYGNSEHAEQNEDNQGCGSSSQPSSDNDESEGVVSPSGVSPRGRTHVFHVCDECWRAVYAPIHGGLDEDEVEDLRRDMDVHGEKLIDP